MRTHTLGKLCGSGSLTFDGRGLDPVNGGRVAGADVPHLPQLVQLVVVDVARLGHVSPDLLVNLFKEKNNICATRRRSSLLNVIAIKD